MTRAQKMIQKYRRRRNIDDKMDAFCQAIITMNTGREIEGFIPGKVTNIFIRSPRPWGLTTVSNYALAKYGWMWKL
jgi:hypothetical protein